MFLPLITYSLPPGIEAHNITESSIAVGGEQQQRLSQCKAAMPYLIAVPKPSNENIVSMVMRMIVFRGSEIVQVGVNEVIWGTTSSSLFLMAPTSNLTTYLNPVPTNQEFTGQPSACSTPFHRSDAERIELHLDSVTLSDNTVIGADVYGVVDRSQKNKLALGEMLARLRSANGNQAAVEADLRTFLAAEPETSTQFRQNFYPLELKAWARIVLLQLKNGEKLDEIIDQLTPALAAKLLKNRRN